MIALERRPGYGAIHRTGIEKAKSEPAGKRPGDRALAGAGRSINGYDHGEATPKFYSRKFQPVSAFALTS
jgi:hypothetical protein